MQFQQESFTDAILVMNALYKTIQQFFPQINSWINTINDPRVQGKTTYPLSVMIWEAILLYLLKLGSRRQIKWLLKKDPIAVLSHLAHLTKEDLSHFSTIACDDAIDDLFRELLVQQVQHVVQEMIRHLIKERKLEYARLLGTYYMIAIDGTGLFHRHTQHCPYCLIKKSKSGEMLYSHNVLEAKLITENGFAFSIASEHIENKDGFTYDLSNEKEKQDCELNAFKRLAPKIKEAFPKLPICLLIDSLYAAQTVMDICKEYGWVYIINYKEGSIPSVYEEFENLLPLQSENRINWETNDAHQKICWVNDINYQKHTVHVIRSLDTYKESGEQKTFLYLTNVKPTKANVIALANGGGRQRWKVENQGFNMQKNGGYNLEHVYSENENSAKCFYLCLQIAHILNQLLEKGSLIGDASKKFGSIKNLSGHLRDAIRKITIGAQDIHELLKESFQIRIYSNSS